MAALRGYWRGRNKADNEEAKKPRKTGGRDSKPKGEEAIRKKFVDRYKGNDD